VRASVSGVSLRFSACGITALDSILGPLVAAVLTLVGICKGLRVHDNSVRLWTNKPCVPSGRRDHSVGRGKSPAAVEVREFALQVLLPEQLLPDELHVKPLATRRTGAEESKHLGHSSKTLPDYFKVPPVLNRVSSHSMQALDLMSQCGGADGICTVVFKSRPNQYRESISGGPAPKRVRKADSSRGEGISRRPDFRAVGCSALLGFVVMIHSDDHFSSGVSFSKIPKSFSGLT